MKFRFIAFLLLSILSSTTFAGLEEGAKAYDSGQYDVALLELTPLATDGDARAQAILGLMHQYGKGTPIDIPKAIEWYTKAANSEDGLAQSQLGALYHEGLGVPKDFNTSLTWFKKAANNKNSVGMSAVADQYYFGQGVERNESLAAEWYRKSAEQDNAYAQYCLGWMYSKGQGVERNSEMALLWLDKAVKGGYKDAKEAYADVQKFVNQNANRQFYIVTNTGPTYGWFSDKDVRRNKIDDFLAGLSKPLKKQFLESNDGLYFEPSVGDIGFMVADIEPKKTNGRVVISIDGNLILIEKKGLKKSDFRAYENFLDKISDLGDETFGFRLGVTTESEAISLLKSMGADFKSGLAYKGYTDIPIIRINSFNKMPVIKNQAPASCHLFFFDNVLYQIQFTWLPRSNFFSDIERFDSLHIEHELKTGLLEKYKREPKNEFPDDGSYINHYWLNAKKHITVKNARNREYKSISITLEYNQSKLLDRSIAVKKVIDELVEKKQEEEKMNRLKSQL